MVQQDRRRVDREPVPGVGYRATEPKQQRGEVGLGHADGGHAVGEGEGGDDAVALRFRGVTEDGGGGEPAAPDRLGDVRRVLDPGTEGEPAAAAGAEPHHLVDGRLGHLGEVDGRLQLTGDELAAAAADARHVEPGLGGLADERAEPAVVDQLPHRNLEGDVGEERALALVQHAAIEAVGGGGEADDLELRIDAGERVEEAAVHGVGAAGDQVRLVDQHQVALLHVVGAAMDRLDSGEEDEGPEVAPPEPGGVDAGRRVPPEPDQLGVVLRDQLADVRDDQDALVGPRAQHPLDEGRHSERFSTGGRDHHERMAGVLREVAVDRVDGRLLVGAQRQHATASARASLIQVAPSRIR